MTNEVPTERDYAESIELPTHQLFKHIMKAKRFALDIGGSLVKLAYYSTVPKKKTLVIETKQSDSKEIYKVSETDELRDQLHFIKFETKYMETCIDFIRQNLLDSRENMKGKIIKVTGGGAYKYKDLLCNRLGIQVDKEDEMQCLIKGCDFLLRNIPDEAFVYQRTSNPEYRFLQIDEDSIFPYLLVNIGSGVSLIMVKSATEFERIGGSSMGGGTFWGLGSILTKAKGFDELLELAEKGDHKNVDMLVRDIYGGAYSKLGLPADLIASSFGRAARSARDRESEVFGDSDMAKSLLISISNDIGQIASLTAKLHSLNRIFFGGYFIRGHPITMYTMTFAINYWSKGEIQAMFLRHEGYLGAIGAFLKGIEEEDTEKYCWCESVSWIENYAGSSVLKSPKSKSFMDMLLLKPTFDVLELDRFTKPLVSFPLLFESSHYSPDTVDLAQDEEARTYWLDCFEEATEKFAQRAVSSQPSKGDAEERAARFKEKYIGRLRYLKNNPSAYGSLTVRSLLDTREHCLEEFHFVDTYTQQKQQENEQALELWSKRINQLDKLNLKERWIALAVGILAGNVFDWGAKEVAQAMETCKFGYQEALDKIPSRPWLIDNLDDWLERMLSYEDVHNCSLIFVDNSGLDIILGVFPFARSLLDRGTKVILCANSRPVINDVTYNELTILTKRVADRCPIISSALSEGRLLVMESGQGSPCLDLRYIDYDLRNKVEELRVDIVILEGMGRSVHTNFFARFTCDCLKVSTLKNRWLANKFGGKMYDVIFKYEKKSALSKYFS